MNKQFILYCIYIIAFISPISAQAAIYKHVDENGRVTYSNVKIKGAKKIDLEPADTSFGTNTNKEAAPTTKKATPKNFPNVDANTQKDRDNLRKEILASELKSEKKALEQAKKAYEEGKSNPETFRTANGGIRRNVAKYQEKMKNLQANIDEHKRNIEHLQKELNNMN